MSTIVVLQRRRLVGAFDLFWVAALTGACAWILLHLVHHVHLQVELYQFGHEVVELDIERNRLLEEQQRLHAELEYRRNAVDTARYATDVLGMVQVQPAQVFHVGVR